MARLVLEIWDIEGGAIAVTCSADVDVATAPVTSAMLVMSTIIESLQENAVSADEIKTRTH